MKYHAIYVVRTLAEPCRANCNIFQFSSNYINCMIFHMQYSVYVSGLGRPYVTYSKCQFSFFTGLIYDFSPWLGLILNDKKWIGINLNWYVTKWWFKISRRKKVKKTENRTKIQYTDLVKQRMINVYTNLWFKISNSMMTMQLKPLLHSLFTCDLAPSWSVEGGLAGGCN